jgi:hypothetical protein
MKRKLAAAIAVLSLTAPNLSHAEDTPGITYKGVNIQLGGFLASETVYRTNNMASDIGTSYNKLTFPSDQGYGVSEFRGSERQSRFSLLAQGDTEGGTHLTGYYELDFLGNSPSANENESNSFTPRTRNVYMTADWQESGWHVLAGQNWSLVTMNTKGITARSEYIPPTVDAQYEVGFQWARQWQMRLVKDWQKVFWAAISLEQSQTVAASGAPASDIYQEGSPKPGVDGTTPGKSLLYTAPSINSYPDVVLKFAWEPEFGHFEIYNLMRNFESRYGGTSLASDTSKQSKWTDAVGAGLIVPFWQKQFEVAVSGLFGQGIGRYGTAQIPDATYAVDGSLNPLSGAQYLAQLTWHGPSNVDVYASYGQESVSASAGNNGTAFGYGDGATPTNAGCTTLGGTCAAQFKSVNQVNVGAWWSFYKGNYGTGKLGVQYSHTTVATFADATGFAPSTKEDMVFTSLRFYPF